MGNDWHVIEMAPKDGTEVLVVYQAPRGPRVTLSRWSLKLATWWTDVGDVPATHWMPLPDPPDVPWQEHDKIDWQSVMGDRDAGR